MDYETFKAQFCQCLQDIAKRIYGNAATVRHATVHHDNQDNRECVIILKDENGAGIAPSIYPEEYYQKYVEEGTPFTELVADALLQSETIPDALNQVLQQVSGGNMEDFARKTVDFENVKEHVRYRLACPYLNKDEFQDVPSMPLPQKALGLSKIYYFNISSSCFGMVTHGLLEAWNIDLQELDRIASANMEQYEPVTTESYEADGITGYHVSTLNYCFGAACLAYDHIFQHLAGIVGSMDYIIIPHDVHSLVVLPHRAFDEKIEITAMKMATALMRENMAKENKEDILSLAVYIVEDGECVRSMIARPLPES